MNADIVGQRFGRLVVLSQGPAINWHRTYVCRCDCGEETRVRGSSLQTGNTRSCGCLRAEIALGVPTHGHRGRRTRTYKSWTAMRERCLNPNTGNYANYGGRGISCCARWDSFENFLADMGERPEDTSLDRINNDGNYEPGNCRWATRAVQNSNRRTPARASSRRVTPLAQAIWNDLQHDSNQSRVARNHGTTSSYVNRIARGLSGPGRNFSA